MSRTVRRPDRIRRAALSGALLAVLVPAGAGAQLVLTLRQGKAWVESSDLRLRGGGSDLTLRDVAWEDGSYRAPIYYGAGLTWWMPRHPRWGLGIDFTHAKAILDGDVTVQADGRLAGAPFHDAVPVREVVPHLELSHGLNLATAGVYRRWVADTGPEPDSGVALYVGLGAGVVAPHVGATVAGRRTDEYQLAGPAARGVIGLDVPWDEHVSLVGEAILSWADVRAELTGGDRVQTRLWVPQVSLGISLRD
jgi:lipid A oxidase